MNKVLCGAILSTVLVMTTAVAEAQQLNTSRVGIIATGGSWYATIDGLRIGLRELGLEEGEQFALVIRDTKGDLKAAEDAAKYFEHEKVNLIYTTQTSVTIAAKRATVSISI